MLANLVNPDLAVMPLWMWGIFFYGLFSLVTRVTNFLCNDRKKKRKVKRG